MNNIDYREILESIRRQLRDSGFGSIDERIVSNMRGSEGAFWDVNYYLTHLQEEIRLGSDLQYRETLRRVRQYVTTGSGEDIQGIRVTFSPEEVERYQRPYFDISPSRELGEIAQEINILIEELGVDYRRQREIDQGPTPEVDL